MIIIIIIVIITTFRGGWISSSFSTTPCLLFSKFRSTFLTFLFLSPLYTLLNDSDSNQARLHRYSAYNNCLQNIFFIIFKTLYILYLLSNENAYIIMAFTWLVVHDSIDNLTCKIWIKK